METDSTSLTGLILMFVLGLRHGLDPDHIACIDGLTWRALSQNRSNAPWIGTLFAIGHGLLVTFIAVAVSKLAYQSDVPEVLIRIFEWIPTLLLLLVGTMNLRMLLRPQMVYAPVGWKMKFIPRKLQEHSSPWAVVIIGVLFATVFDTATQASAWGYVASNNGGGVLAALAAGLVFTVGMVITDSIDGRIICSINSSTKGQKVGHQYRRTLGWLIVSISYGVALYNLGKAIFPQLELGDSVFSLIGASLVCIMLVILAAAAISKRHTR